MVNVIKYNNMFRVNLLKLSRHDDVRLVNKLRNSGFSGGDIGGNVECLILNFNSGTYEIFSVNEWYPVLPEYDIEKIWSNEVGIELNSRRIKPTISKNQTIDQKLEIIKHFLNGEKCQFIHSGEQWHNITPKFKLESLMKDGVRIRVAPKKVNIDGHSFTKEQALSYIDNNY